MTLQNSKVKKKKPKFMEILHSCYAMAGNDTYTVALHSIEKHS